jgi:hypothetical protein
VFSGVEIVNANQRISTWCFCATFFGRECVGDGVILPHFIYASSNASFFIAARMYGFSFQHMVDAPIFWWWLISSWAYRQSTWMPFALNGHF